MEHGHSHWERHGVAGKVLEERMRRASSRQAAFILKVLEEQNGKALKHQSFLTYHEPLARLHPQLLPWQHGRRQLFGATFSLPADKASTSKALTALRFRRIRLSISAKTNSPSCSDPMAACKLFIEGLLSRTAHKTCHTHCRGNSEQLWPKLASKYSRFPKIQRPTVPGACCSPQQT